MHGLLLSNLSVLSLTGADRRSFLQGQITQDMARVGAEAPTQGALLTSQGRVLALPWLVEREDELLLILPTDCIAAIGAHLKRYILRAKAICSMPGMRIAVAGILPSVLPATLTERLQVLPLSNRALLLGEHSELTGYLTTHTQPLAPCDWEWACVMAGEPTVTSASAETFIPQMLNLDLLDAISFTKGCYTGQEIVARTQHLGRIKRRMFLYEVSNAPASKGQAPAPLTPLSSGADKVGEVVRSAKTSTATRLLAVVTIDAHLQALTLADGSALTHLPLPYTIIESAL